MASASWLVLLSLASLLSAACCADHTSLVEVATANYRFSTQLSDEPAEYDIYWSFDLNIERIDFAVIVKTTGWIGFGISPTGMMPRSDVVIGWVDDDGQAFFNDRYANGRFTPPIDEEQNWFLLEGQQVDGYTMLRFWRNFTSCDELDLNIPSGTARVVGSYHNMDPTSPDQRFPVHQFMRAKSVNLLKGSPTDRTIPSDSNSFNIQNKNYTIPASDTTYWCSIHYHPYLIHDVDTYQDPVYLYKISPLIKEENRKFVHHMLVFLCPRDSTVETDGICDDIASGSFFGCYGGQIISAWAVGGEDYTFPEGVALPLGGIDRPYKILLEVHYNNPDLKDGIVDSAGMQFFYTREKPTFEAGGISVALPIVPLMIVPPKADLFKHTATCLSTCTDRFLPDDGITVFATFLHTHLIGTALNVRHYRENSECGATEELPLIDSNPSYDFDYQQLSNLPKSLKVLKGDTVRVECFYNSRLRSQVTTGGESTREEMCQALLYYYPRTGLTNCGSFPDPNTAHRPFLENVFNNDNSRIDPVIDALNNDDYTTITTAFNSIQWSPSTIQEFQNAMETAQLEREFCSGELNSTGVATPVRPAVIVHCPLVKPERCSSSSPEPIPCCERQEDEDDSGSGAATTRSTPLALLMGFLITYAVNSIFKT